MRNLVLSSRRTRTSCSVLALATVMTVGATPAAAQSLLGSGTFATNGAGSAGITTTPTTTTITVNPGQSVIDWTPTDNATGGGAIGFQLGGTTATFNSTNNFAVLNRINQTDISRAISMNGTINSRINGQQGGSLYFYSPGGFLLGSGSVINVGSLVLSASPITVDGTGNFINGVNNQVIFGQAPRATAAIVTTAGSTINASDGDAYVAMVAPRVQHGGSITVNGSAALVAAEAATINFSPSGLFDIQVSAGSTDTNGIAATGTITGAASTGAADIHRAYLVAVPKNSAMTMLIGAGSNLGFNVAGAAEVVGNTVVLSAGHDISNGGIGQVSTGSTAAAVANLQVTDSNFTSAVVGEATGYAHLSAFNPMRFYSDATIHANGEIWFSTQAAAGTINVDRNLSLSTERYAANGQSMNTASVDVFNVNGGGRITVNGATNLNSTAHGGSSFTNGIAGGNATAGLVRVNAASGGLIQLLGGVTATADAYAGSGGATGANGGNATGGNVRLVTSGINSNLTVAGGATLSSNAYGGSGNGGECLDCDGIGGNGQGGSIRVVSGNAGGSAINIAGGLTGSANGFGGSATALNRAAGSGRGGEASFYVGTGNTNTLTGDLLLVADGVGGNSSLGNGGSGTGGLAALTEAVGATSGTTIVNGNVELSTDGRGGTSGGDGTRGGDGNGGTGANGAYLLALNTSLTVNGGVYVHSDGAGGSARAGIGGDAHGGQTYIISQRALSVSGRVNLSSGAQGGSGATGGNGTGGDASIAANNGGSLSLTGSVTNSISASATGGDSSNGNGGVGNGGTVNVYAVNAASALNIAGSLAAQSNGVGGFGQGPGTGGDGIGGAISIYTNSGAALTVSNNLLANADGYGGDGDEGGFGRGGVISVSSQSTLNVGGLSSVTARGFGGDVANLSVQGQATNQLINVAGDGLGGNIEIYAQNGTLTLAGAVTMDANGRGGSASVVGDTAGNGFGGSARVLALAGGTTNLQSSLNANAVGYGGYQENSQIIGGDGHGGIVTVEANGANAHLTVGGSTRLDASGVASGPGGECNFCGGVGGDGFGGSVSVQTIGSPSATLAFNSNLSGYAQGTGGIGTRADGGDGTGGTVMLQVIDGGSLRVSGDATLYGDGTGGYSYNYNTSSLFAPAHGGDGTGGILRIQTLGTGSALISIDGSAYLYARGYGGDAVGFNVGRGGDGTGGTTHVNSQSGLINIGDPEFGYGNLEMSSYGIGGDAFGGTGGDGFGGEFAGIDAINGDVTVLGHATLTGGGTGGDGLYGGNGTGSGDHSDADPINWTGGVHIFAKNGDVTIGGGAFLTANGSGGDGGHANGYSGDYGGNGGNGFGGWADIQAANSALGPSHINILSGNVEGSGTARVEANATGGIGGNSANGRTGTYGIDGGYGIIGGNGTNGANGTAGIIGGNGGNATAGVAGILAASDNGHIGISFAEADAIAAGGDGGRGGGGGMGGAGGNGGDSTGTETIGGAGGNGGNGGAGGNGGTGGSAIGGNTTIGTSSGNAQAIGLGLGTGTFGTVTLNSSATGGDGGDGGANGFGGVPGFGGSGSTIAGANGTRGNDGALGGGGAGGNATGGAATLIVRGSTVAVDSATLTADATGGDGGLGFDTGYGTVGIDGAGGNARVGGDGRGIHVTVSSRFQRDTQRGTLNAGSITGTAIATGGVGSSYGNSDTFGGSGVTFRNADGNIDLLDFLVQADGAPTSDADIVSVINGDVTVGGEFRFITSGNMSLFLDGGDFTADNIVVHAYDFVNDAANGTPVDNGTFFARHFDIATDNNFLTTANLDSVEALTILAPGSIYVANINVDSSVDLEAVNGEVIIGNLLANGDVTIDAAQDIRTGTINNSANTSLDAGGSINVGAIDSGYGAVSLLAGSSISGSTIDARSIFGDSGSSIFLTQLTATGGDIELVAIGDILVGTLLASETIDLSAGGYVDGGNMTAGDTVAIKAGESVNVGDVSAGIVNHSSGYDGEYNVAILAGTTIDTGDIEAFNSVGLAARGNISTGTIDAGRIFMALGGGNMNFGAIDAGDDVYLANYSMMALGGTVTDVFDPAPILAARPVASGGSITINGPVTTGNMRASAGTTLTVGAINARGLVDLASGGAMQTQNITAGQSIMLNSGGSISGGNLIANTLVRVAGIGAVNVGNITIVHPSGQRELGATAANPVGSPVEVFGASTATGNVTTDGYVGLYSAGALTAGNVNAATDVIALAGGNATLGAITTPGRFILGGYSMFAGLTSGSTFTPTTVFTLTKAKTGGSATFGGSSSVGSFQAFVGTDTTLQSLQTTTSALIDTGGVMTLNGTLNGTSQLISNDIDLGASAAVSTGNLQLVSRNATQTVVGDGVTGGGYQLSDAEFDRIHTPLSVVADTTYGAAAKMLIGNLSATVSGTSQTGYNYLFATVNGTSTTSVGSIRVVGNASFSGLSLTDNVVLRSNLIELDAATASINLLGQGTTLGGVLGLYAPRVWVASADILAKLEVNARYTGYITDLNAPAAVQRPDGVLRAASFDIDALSEPIQSLLVQNTGTKAIPAGFLLTDLNIDSESAPDALPGSIDLVINGQVISQSVTATGIAVRDGLVAEFGTTQFTSTSTINGCALTGSCSSNPLLINLLAPTDVQLVDNGGLGDGLFGNEPDISGEVSGDEGSPITPPLPLFDTRPLTPDEEINDPASGAGNPSLYGNPDDDTDSDQKKKKKTKKGDGN